jgi:hypothetical protein
MNKLQVNEPNLVAMIKAFKEYEALIAPIAEDQPAFKKLAEFSNDIMVRLITLNKMIHRKYDGMSNELYLLELNRLLKGGGK